MLLGFAARGAPRAPPCLGATPPQCDSAFDVLELARRSIRYLELDGMARALPAADDMGRRRIAVDLDGSPDRWYLSPSGGLVGAWSVVTAEPARHGAPGVSQRFPCVFAATKHARTEMNPDEAVLMPDDDPPFCRPVVRPVAIVPAAAPVFTRVSIFDGQPWDYAYDPPRPRDQTPVPHMYLDL